MHTFYVREFLRDSRNPLGVTCLNKVLMDGWMDGWMDGLIDRLID